MVIFLPNSPTLLFKSLQEKTYSKHQSIDERIAPLTACVVGQLQSNTIDFFSCLFCFNAT